MPKVSSRFHCPSITLDLKGLLSKSRKLLYLCVVLAISVHLVATRWASFQVEQKAVQPLTTKFVKRAPRLTKPLEMKKRPRPKRRMMRRKMVSIKARVNRKEVSSVAVSIHVVGRLARPDASVYREVAFAQTDLEPEAVATSIEGAMQPKDNVNMSLEMVDIDALDTGRYHAMVIQDPRDKRNIKGFFHMAIAYSESMRLTDHHGQEHRTVHAFRRLVKAINKYTNIRADITNRITFDSREMMKIPWVYSLTVTTFQLTESEAFYLGKYLLSGGFLVTDITHHGYVSTVPVAIAIRQEVIDALESQGMMHEKDWEFERLPNSHPVYHCFFDFDSGPPMCGDRLIITEKQPDLYTHDYLEGVNIDHRLVAIVSQKWLANPWGDWGPDGANSGYSHLDPTRPFQFGVNLVVFALTQEGSITNRVMDAVQ